MNRLTTIAAALLAAGLLNGSAANASDETFGYDNFRGPSSVQGSAAGGSESTPTGDTSVFDYDNFQGRSHVAEGSGVQREARLEPVIFDYDRPYRSTIE